MRSGYRFSKRLRINPQRKLSKIPSSAALINLRRDTMVDDGGRARMVHPEIGIGQQYHPAAAKLSSGRNGQNQERIGHGPPIGVNRLFPARRIRYLWSKGLSDCPLSGITGISTFPELQPELQEARGLFYSTLILMFWRSRSLAIR